MSCFRTVVWLLCFAAVLCLLPQAGFAQATTDRGTGPVLAIPRRVEVAPGQEVVLPVEFVANGADVCAVLFRLEFDATLLRVTTVDGDVDGNPDAVRAKVPAGYTFRVTASESGGKVQLDFFIADMVPPLTGLPDGPIAEIVFSAGRPQTSVEVTVGFSMAPPPSFGSTKGQSVAGRSADGSILIALPQGRVPTPLPTTVQALPPEATSGVTAARGPSGETTAVAPVPGSVETVGSTESQGTDSAPTAAPVVGGSLVGGATALPSSPDVIPWPTAQEGPGQTIAPAAPEEATALAAMIAAEVSPEVPTTATLPLSGQTPPGRGTEAGPHVALAVLVAAGLILTLWLARSRLGQ